MLVLAVSVCTSLHGTQSDIYMSVAASVQNMALLIVHISILVFTCSVCILSSLIPSPPPHAPIIDVFVLQAVVKDWEQGCTLSTVCRCV